MPSLNNSLVKWSLASERVSKAIGNRAGSIRVVVHEPWIKDEIFKNRRELKESGIYLKEELTKQMREVDFKARNAFKNGKYYTRLDHVLVIFEENAVGVKCPTRESLLNLIAKVDAKGLTDYLRAPHQKGDEPMEPEQLNPEAADGAREVNPLAALSGPKLLADLKVVPDQLDTFIERSQALCKRLQELKQKPPPEKVE